MSYDDNHLIPMLEKKTHLKFEDCIKLAGKARLAGERQRERETEPEAGSRL